jgi:hypothetical protein
MPGVDRCDQAVQVDLQQLDNSCTEKEQSDQQTTGDDTSEASTSKKIILEDTSELCSRHNEDFVLHSLPRKRDTCNCATKRLENFYYVPVCERKIVDCPNSTVVQLQ